MQKIYMVRHGKTDWNELGIIQGLTDTDLNQNGINEIKELSKELPIDEIDVVLCSPLKRARQTAELLVQGKKEIIIDELLTERCFGDLEGTKFILEDFAHYQDYKLNDDSKNVESIKDCMKRAEKFLEKIKQNYPDKTILVVSHGGFIKYLHFCIIGYDENTDFLSFFAKNSTIYEYMI
ncbi:MAG: histidine phosphatase family protein [Bacilli bacterium]